MTAGGFAGGGGRVSPAGAWLRTTTAESESKGMKKALKRAYVSERTRKVEMESLWRDFRRRERKKEEIRVGLNFLDLDRCSSMASCRRTFC